jgi:hypothetical protein
LWLQAEGCSCNSWFPGAGSRPRPGPVL